MAHCLNIICLTRSQPTLLDVLGQTFMIASINNMSGFISLSMHISEAVTFYSVCDWWAWFRVIQVI